MMARLKKWLGAAVYHILFLLVSPKRRPKQGGTASPKEITIIFFAALGDFIVFCDVAKRLCDAGYRLRLLCRGNCGIDAFAALVPHFCEVRSFSNRYFSRIANLWQFSRITTDAVIAVPPHRQVLTDLYALAVRADVRVGIACDGAACGRLEGRIARCYDRLVSLDAVSEPERYARLFEGAGFCTYTPGVFVLENVQRPTRGHACCVAIFPGASGGAAKCWPIERFAQVAKHLHVQKGAQVKVLGTRQERGLGERLLQLLGNPPWAENLCGETDIAQTIEAVLRCDLVLANDSGSAHMAIAADVPTIIIAGCWEYGRFYPNRYLSPRHRVLMTQEELACFNCGDSCPRCSKNTARCILGIDAQAVANSAELLF